MKEVAVVAEAPEAETGMVLYSDGGARPTSRGNGGYGLHGYMYKEEPPKKGPGKAGIALTKEGYVAKTDDVVSVTPIHYIDSFGSLGTSVTNNYAEMMGAMRGLQEASQYAVKRVKIMTDSKYVVEGINKNHKQWIRDNWMTMEGKERPNTELWKQLVATRDELAAKNVAIKFQWISGHQEKGTPDYDIGEALGNDTADALATLGVMHNRKGTTEETIDRTTADGYWSYDSVRHPFLFHRRVYFNTMSQYNVPGQYYLGDHGKDDDLLGKRISDGCYAVVRLVTPDAAIEKVRAHQIEVSGNIDALAMMRLDNLFRPTTHAQVINHGVYAMEQKDPKRHDLYCIDREPLSREIDPPRIAVRAIESLVALEEKLNWYLTKDPRAAVTDLTSILYETVVKTPKKGEPTSSMVLLDKYNVGFAALATEANYPSEEGVKSASVSLSLGIDILDRNALKRLESESPKVSLISWLEGPNIFRYAVVIEASGNVGIWCGVYSNLRIVS